MDNNQQNASQSLKDYRTRIGHYNTLAEALAAAMLKGNLVWRIYDETREPFDLVEIYRFAKKYDQEHPITGTQFYWVSREGAIGISMGLEYRVKWLFIPMEEGLERDDLVVKMGERMAEVEEVKGALNPQPVQQPAQQSVPQLQPVQQPAPQPVPRPVQQPLQQPTPKPQPQPVQRPVQQPEAQPQPMPQPVQQPMPRPIQQPAPQPQPVPRPIQQPAPQPQPVPRPVQQPAPQPISQPVQQPQPQPVQQPAPQPAAQSGSKSKLPLIIGGVVAALLITGGGYFAYNHFVGSKEAPVQQEITTTTTESENQTTEPTVHSSSDASDTKALTTAAINELKSATTAQQGIDKLNQAIAKGDKESVEALYTLAQLYGRVYSDKDVLANVEKLLPKDTKKAHELNEKAVALDNTYYPSLYELGCDYMAGEARGAVDRDIDKAKQYFTQGIKYAQEANDTQLVERFEIRLSSLE